MTISTRINRVTIGKTPENLKDIIKTEDCYEILAYFSLDSKKKWKDLEGK